MGEVLRIEAVRTLPCEDVVGRLKRMASVLAAIDAGDLLAVPPQDPAARANHEVALDLLAMMHAELKTLSEELDGGWGNS